MQAAQNSFYIGKMLFFCRLKSRKALIYKGASHIMTGRAVAYKQYLQNSLTPHSKQLRILPDPYPLRY